MDVLRLGVQLHGGSGYMNDYPIARIRRDARVRRIYGGSSEIMRELIGRSLQALADMSVSGCHHDTGA